MQTRREHLATLLGLGGLTINCGYFAGVFNGAQREREEMGVKRYEILVDEFHSLMSSDPLRLVEREDFSRASELPDVSKEEIERNAARMISLADKIRASDHSGASFDQRLDLELAENWLRVKALEVTLPVDETPKYAVYPNPLVDLLALTPLYLERDPRAKGKIVDDLISRLGHIGLYLDQTLARMDRPVAVWVKRDLDAGKDFDGLAEGVRKFAVSIGYDHMASLGETLGSAKAVVTSYMARLDAMPKRTVLSVGERNTEKIFRLKGVDIPLGELHRLAIEYLQGNFAELGSLRPKLIAKHGLDPRLDVIGVANELKVRFASPQGGVVDLANKLLRQSEAFVYEHGLVRKIDNQSSRVERAADYLKPIVPIAAIIPPGMFGRGERKSTFYVNEFPGIERGLNRLNLPAITAHELVPGHHYQLTRATEHPSKVRAWIEPMDLVEGWAVRVAEQIMVGEIGYVGDPKLKTEEHYMAKVDQLRIGARVCFVLALMTGDRKYFENPLGVKASAPDMLDAATEFYRGVTGFVEARARGDTEVFSSLGTYGALYLVGSNMLKDMESQGRRKHGDIFSRPKFLESVLQEGMMPLSYVKRSLEHRRII